MSTSREPVTREFEASLDQLQNVMDFVESELEIIGCSMKSVMQIDVAIEEIFVNIAHYAYAGNRGMMSLTISESDGFAYFEFKDSGIFFNPLDKADPDISQNAEDRKIGGLGIYMVKKTMDDVSYRYEDNQNILTLKKKIS